MKNSWVLVVGTATFLAAPGVFAQVGSQAGGLDTEQAVRREAAAREAIRKEELADAILAARETAAGRELGTKVRSQLKQDLRSLSLDRLEAFFNAGGLGDIEAAVRGPGPRALGDSAADLVFTPVNPCRIINTTIAGGILAGGGSARPFKVTGSAAGTFEAQGGNAGGCQIPTSATAVEMNFIAVAPAGAGNLRAYPFSTPPAVPNASVINYANVAGMNVANGIAQPICNLAAGPCANDLLIQADVSSTHVIVDVVGYFNRVDKTLIKGETGKSVTFGSLTAFLGCGTYQSIDVTAPAPGMVLIRGDMTFQLNHTFGTASEVSGFISNSVSECSGIGSGNIFVGLPASAPTGTYFLPLSLSRRFAVGAGESTFHMNFSKAQGASISAFSGGMDFVFNPN